MIRITISYGIPVQSSACSQPKGTLRALRDVMRVPKKGAHDHGGCMAVRFIQIAVRERLPWPVAVEFRGGGWMEADRQSRTLKLLEDLGLAYVSVDEPQGFPSARR